MTVFSAAEFHSHFTTAQIRKDTAILEQNIPFPIRLLKPFKG
jgi:hypothetical protein